MLDKYKATLWQFFSLAKILGRFGAKQSSRMKITSFFTVFTFLCIGTVLLSAVSDCSKSFYVHWNTSNPIFHLGNIDHIIAVNQGNTQFEYDQVNIICPVYAPAPGTEDDPEVAEKYIIYNVSKEEYDSCRISNPSPRIVAVCDKPHKLMYYTITFRPFTPQPGGLEFPPGRDYYFISTSSKDDLHRRMGGRCATHNMKIVFKVCCRPEDSSSRASIFYNRTKSPVYYSTSTIAPRPPRVDVNRGSGELASINKFQKPTPKKTLEYEDHPNEIVKNEELHNAAVAISASAFFALISFASLVL